MKLKYFKVLFLVLCFSSLLFLSSCEALDEPEDTRTENVGGNDGGSKSTSTQCLGYTQKGNRCKNMTKSSSGYCYLHD